MFFSFTGSLLEHVRGSRLGSFSSTASAVLFEE